MYNSNDEIINKNDVISLYQNIDVELTIEILQKLKSLENYKNLSKKSIAKKRNEYGLSIYLLSLTMVNKSNSVQLKGLKNLFSNSVINDMKKYTGKYEELELDFKIEKEQLKIVNQSIKSTNNTLKSLGRKIAKGAKKDMLKSFDKIIKQVVNGSETFDYSFKHVSSELTEKGITFEDRLGRNRSIESTVRQELRYRVNECSRSNLKYVGEKLDTDGWQINITSNCRPTHQVINGQRFTNEEWKNFEHLTHDYNCNHVAEPIFMWESEKYTQKEIKNANNRTVKYKGEKISYYDATQKQRAFERTIRNAKKQCEIAKKMDLNVGSARSNLLKAQSNMRNFIAETGLTRNYSREYFAGYN